MGWRSIGRLALLMFAWPLASLAADETPAVQPVVPHVVGPVEVMGFPASVEPGAAAGRGARGTGTEPEAVLRDEIRLRVVGLQAQLDKEHASLTKARIVLFLDGRPILGASPYPPLDPADEKLAFVLQRDEDSRDAWTHLLGKPDFQTREVAVSVGLSDQYPVPSDARIRLRPISKAWFAAWAVLFAAMVTGFLLLASRSDLLRDWGPAPEPAHLRKAYSLAKTQAMWWFFLVVASYLFIGLVTGDYGSTINGTVLSLIGISVATTIGGAIIDNPSTRSTGARSDAAKASAVATRAAVAANAANTLDALAGSPATAATAETAAVTATVAADNAARAAAAAASAAPQASVADEHWWLDLLSDDSGVSFHRFQMVAWTLILGVVFVHDVYIDLAMPTFDGSLLGLLGISSGTYLGLKVAAEQ